MSSIDSVALSERDNVVVLPRGGKRGDGDGSLIIQDDIPPGHKTARRLIASGEAVVKYGRPIGRASRDIKPGEWAHTHNVVTCLDTNEDFPEWIAPDIRGSTPPGGSFMGYRGTYGRPGVRNDLWIIPTVGCINGELRSLASSYEKPKWIDSVRTLEHPYGCSQLGDDIEMTKSILAGLAGNPNAAGVLLVGLGCENLRVSDILDRINALRPGSPAAALTLQNSAPGALQEALDALAESSPRTREKFQAPDLCVGVKCGGSDGYSGLSANPLVGRFSDWLASNGGAVLATEIPEMFGAEEVIASRAADRSVYDSFTALDRWFRDYFTRHGQPIYENPSPGNKEVGITTLEEKSLGAVAKTWISPVTAILSYGERERGAGVQISFAPGNDPVSCTSLAGSGAQIILFTTGRGTPFGTVIPTVKISTNSNLAKLHPDWIDFDAGSLLDGEPWEEAASRLVSYVLRVASGEKTANERKNTGEIAIFKDGVTL